MTVPGFWRFETLALPSDTAARRVMESVSEFVANTPQEALDGLTPWYAALSEV